jgi:predicted Zn-dependent peptidase
MNNSFKKKVLDNGMTILFEKRDLPVVSIGFAVRAGGINESLEEKGISHFIEHMLYKGTPTRDTKKIAEDIEKNGGMLNGFTSDTITAYYCKMPSKHLDVALDVLSDMVKNPLFDKNELEKERLVIFEEIKMRKDNPRVYVFDEIQRFLYNGTFGVSFIGTYDTMNSITREKILERFKEVYQPNNMILAVVGDADFDSIVEFAKRNFGNEKGRVPLVDFGLKNEVKTEKRGGIDQANLIFAYHVPLAGDKKNYAARVLNTLMADGMSSRLFTEIREKRNLAYAVKGDVEINKSFAYSFVYVGTSKENVEKIREIILEEFKKVVSCLDEKELDDVKKQIIGNYYISMEDSQSQMINLLCEEVEGDAQNFYEFEKNISEVKLEDVKNLAKIGNYSFFALVPE